VSVNHGIFLCENCAMIHQDNYGVEVSYIKPIIDNFASIYYVSED